MLALKVSGYVPSVPGAGVPPSVPVPLPLSVNVTAVGSAPDSVRDGTGDPVVVTVKLPAFPATKVVLVMLVMAGAAPVALPAARKATICMIHAPPDNGAVAL